MNATVYAPWEKMKQLILPKRLAKNLHLEENSTRRKSTFAKYSIKSIQIVLNNNS